MKGVKEEQLPGRQHGCHRRPIRAAGILVQVAPEAYPNGGFAHLDDLEGNRIELWEPAGNDAGGQRRRRLAHRHVEKV